MKTKEYLDMAQEAAREGAHVAAIMYYRSAYDLAGSGPQAGAAEIVAMAVEYADQLKKPTDRLAVYQWASGIAQSESLDAKIAAIQEAE